MTANKEKEIPIKFSPHTKQAEFLANKARFSVLVTGRRWGKTTICIWELVKLALTIPRSNYYYLLPYITQAKKTAWRPFLNDFMYNFPKEIRPIINKSTLSATFPNNSTITFLGTDDPDKLRGDTLHGAVIDEFADHPENLLDEIIIPQFLTTNGVMIITGTPKSQHNHFYKRFLKAQQLSEEAIKKKKQPLWSAHHYTSYDSPLVKEEDIDDIIEGIPEDIARREWLAEFVNLEGLIFPEFNRAKHVISTEKLKTFEIENSIGGIDWGFADPCAILKIAYTKCGKYIVYFDKQRNNMTNDEACLEIKKAEDGDAYKKVDRWYPDSARPEAIKLMRKYQLRTGKIIKGARSIRDGISRLQHLFKHDGLLIHQSCIYLIDELEKYCWEKDKEEPIDKYNHSIDAMRYAIYAHSTQNYLRQKELYDNIPIRQMREEFVKKNKYGI